MTDRLAIFCPGQGGQHAQMFEFARGSLGDLPCRAHLEALLGMPLDRALLDEKLLYSNRIAQPLIVAAAMTTWAAIADFMPEPALIAGYSIGEVAAYGIAGAFDVEAAIDLAAARARLMDDCVQASSPQAMLSISGLRVDRIREIVRQAGCHVAIETGDENLIAGGMRDNAIRLQQRAQEHGARTCMLPLEIASHTPLMHAATEDFRTVVEQSHMANPHIPVLAGISAQRIQSRDEAIPSLASQLEETIRWTDCMDACVEAGVGVVLELGPGAALSRMMKSRHPEIESRSVAEFRTKAGLEKWMARHL